MAKCPSESVVAAALRTKPSILPPSRLSRTESAWWRGWRRGPSRPSADRTRRSTAAAEVSWPLRPAAPIDRHAHLQVDGEGRRARRLVGAPAAVDQPIEVAPDAARQRQPGDATKEI